MKWLFRLCFSLVWISSGVKAEDIIWVGADFPPMAMSQGEYARQGYIDALYKYLKDTSPQHNFTEQVVPWARALHMAKMGGPYCLISAFYTPERAEFLRFTEPYGYVLPIGLIVRADDQSKFSSFLTAGGRLKLNELLAAEDLVIGISSGRSYGPLIDNELRPRLGSDARNIYKAYQNESAKILINMLDHKRFDYMLGYPSEAVFYESPGNKLFFYQIEGNSQLLPGRLSCSKTPATDGVFSDISKIVASQATAAVFQNAYERWLPNYLLGAYRQQVAEMLSAKP
jgi:uncharacterized protein (TIGR02285 family)